MRGANGFQNFLRDLKFLKTLGGCSGVAEFVGVFSLVVDVNRVALDSKNAVCNSTARALLT